MSSNERIENCMLKSLKGIVILHISYTEDYPMHITSTLS